ncbi:MAG: methyltransferase [Bacteroidota bacterium]
MSNSYFSFKKFTVQQAHCAMKVCTDSCIFGAWAGPEKSQDKIKVLDIGTGTGLLSLMLAQRYENVFIDAIEIDEPAAMQATENFTSSPWANRLHAIHSDIEEFPVVNKYDFIISNPPFFHNNLKSPAPRINTARHVHSMDEEVLIKIIDKHLSVSGSFALMISFERREKCLQAAEKSGCFPAKELWVKQTPEHDYFRAMIQFEKTRANAVIQKMCIKEKDNIYSKAYYALMNDYLR